MDKSYKQSSPKLQDCVISFEQTISLKVIQEIQSKF